MKEREQIKSLIKSVPDWPSPGVIFRDIGSLFKHPEGLKLTLKELAASCQDVPFDTIACIDARGFLLGPPLAERFGTGVVLIRKSGKLPGKTIGEEYQLEYGSATIEIQKDALSKGDRVLLLDDLLATGGTILAASNLIAKAGGTVAACRFIVDLPFLKGGEKLDRENIPWQALIKFDGE